MAFRPNSTYSCAFKGTSAQWLDYNTTNNKKISLRVNLEPTLSGLVYDSLFLTSVLSSFVCISVFFMKLLPAIPCNDIIACLRSSHFYFSLSRCSVESPEFFLSLPTWSILLFLCLSFSLSFY